MKKTKSKTLGIRVDRDVHEALCAIKERDGRASHSVVIRQFLKLDKKYGNIAKL